LRAATERAAPAGRWDGRGVSRPADPLLERLRLRLAADGLGLAEAERVEPAGPTPELLLDEAALTELSGQLRAELLGAGPLEPVLAEPGVTDVLVNAADQVYLDRGAGLERAPVRFESD